MPDQEPQVAVAQKELSAIRPFKAEVVELRRRWCFERAMECKAEMDIVEDVIFKAAEIEAYLIEGSNPRANFQSDVEAALLEVDHAEIPNVGDDKKRKVMEVVRNWLKGDGRPRPQSRNHPWKRDRIWPRSRKEPK